MIYSSLSLQYHKGIRYMHKNYKIECYTGDPRQCTKARTRKKKKECAHRKSKTISYRYIIKIDKGLYWIQ